MSQLLAIIWLWDAVLDFFFQKMFLGTTVKFTVIRESFIFANRDFNLYMYPANSAFSRNMCMYGVYTRKHFASRI